MPTKLALTRDINGFNAYGLKPSDFNISVTLTASTDTTYTIPGTDATGGSNYQTKALWLGIFYVTPGSEVWAAVNHAASAPAGDTFALSNSFGDPAAIEFQEGDVLHCFTTQTGVSVSVRFYSLT